LPAGEVALEKLLQLPPEIELPPLEYLSKRSGWSGRNSNASLCKEIKVPPEEAAVSVDELLARGSELKPDCGELPCREVPQTVDSIHNWLCSQLTLFTMTIFTMTILTSTIVLRLPYTVCAMARCWVQHDRNPLFFSLALEAKFCTWHLYNVE
jgi:hypothetical protein